MVLALFCCGRENKLVKNVHESIININIKVLPENEKIVTQNNVSSKNMTNHLFWTLYSKEASIQYTTKYYYKLQVKNRSIDCFLTYSIL